jgi:LmbE family N-acetylglucosaminyl deacetylase
MQRRNFLGSSLAAGMFLTDATAQSERELEAGGTGSTAYALDVTVERKRPGKPHKGKVLAAIQPHCDDIPIFAGGTVLKLLDEGYTGVLITMSNDSMAGEGASIGDIVLKNERDTVEMARRLGVTETFFLNYPNHNMDGWPILEMRARLVFLFRMLKVDTVLVYDPSALYERNPDHYVTARAVESACWMAASEWDYPEHFKVGLKPHGPQEKYYFARGPNWSTEWSISPDISIRRFTRTWRISRRVRPETSARGSAKNWRLKAAGSPFSAITTTRRIVDTPNNSPWRAIAREGVRMGWNTSSTSTTFRLTSPMSRTLSARMRCRCEAWRCRRRQIAVMRRA